MHAHTTHPHDPRVVLCTFPNVDTARSIARTLVEEKLAACVNLVPQIESLYAWEGKVEQSQEVLAIMKTTEAGYRFLEARLIHLHPYEVPEILCLNVEDGLKAYIHWIGDSVSLSHQ